MATNRENEQPLAPVLPQAPKTTADRWDEYRALQASIPASTPARADTPVVTEPSAGEPKSPVAVTREEAPIAERVVAQDVGAQKATQIQNETRTGDNPDLAALKGEDGFEKDTYTAPIEGSGSKGKSKEDKAFKFRNPFVKRPLNE